jgi:hypothetical protein
MFYGLIASKDRTPTDEGYTITVDGKTWEMTELYREYQSAFRKLIKKSITGIRNKAFDPTEQNWELIQEEACEDCAYQTGCGDFIAEEVRFS